MEVSVSGRVPILLRLNVGRRMPALQTRNGREAVAGAALGEPAAQMTKRAGRRSLCTMTIENRSLMGKVLVIPAKLVPAEPRWRIAHWAFTRAELFGVSRSCARFMPSMGDSPEEAELAADVARLSPPLVALNSRRLPLVPIFPAAGVVREFVGEVPRVRYLDAS